MSTGNHTPHKKRQKKRIFRSRVKSLGQPPGSLIHIGEQKVEQTGITAFGYDEGQAVTVEVKNVEECLGLKERFKVLWINVDGLHDTAVIGMLGELFGIDSLTQEDILDTGQRPKAVSYTHLTLPTN